MLWTNLSKFQAFYEIHNFDLVILTIFWWKFGLYLTFFHFSGFGLFWNCLWPNLAFLNFIWRGNSVWQKADNFVPRKWNFLLNNVHRRIFACRSKFGEMDDLLFDWTLTRASISPQSTSPKSQTSSISMSTSPPVDIWSPCPGTNWNDHLFHIKTLPRTN